MSQKYFFTALRASKEYPRNQNLQSPRWEGFLRPPLRFKGTTPTLVPVKPFPRMLTAILRATVEVVGTPFNMILTQLGNLLKNRVVTDWHRKNASIGHSGRFWYSGCTGGRVRKGRRRSGQHGKCGPDAGIARDRVMCTRAAKTNPDPCLVTPPNEGPPWTICGAFFWALRGGLLFGK